MTVLYTIGTWRVSRDAYLSQFKALGIRQVVDVRGNPRAGRQEELKQSKDFERALASAGVTYEYWGRDLGEDAFEGQQGESLEKVLGQLLTQVKWQTLCLLGHLHEPQGCHRLKLCDRLLALKASRDVEVVHLLWEDHRHVRQLQHAAAAAQAACVLRFFEDCKMKAEVVRKDRKVPAPNLEVVTFDKFKPSLFEDGRSYHFKLPFNTDLFWFPQWLSTSEADALERTIQEHVTFIHPTYVFQEPGGGFTKTLIKRGQVRICGDDCPGAVACQNLEGWSDNLLRRVEDTADCAFNCFVANHYAHGRVVINWHSDSGPGDDEGLGPNPHIGSISLGAKRAFSLKSKRQFNGRMIHIDIPLTHGSLLVMGNHSQTHWLHALLHDEACVSERINLTFRFYARESTKHIEGVEHNHEWEAAPGSTRVLLHRTGFGRPVLVDLPDDLEARQLTRYLSTVLPGLRGSAAVSVKSLDGSWRSLGHAAVVVAEARKDVREGQRPEVSVSRGAESHRERRAEEPSSADAKLEKGGAKGASRWSRAATGKGLEAGSEQASVGSRWSRSKGAKGYGRGNRA